MVANWNIINQNYKNLDGYKRVAWPPVSEERIIREFTPQPQNQQSSAQGQLYSPQHLQSTTASPQQQQQQPIAVQQEQASGVIGTPTATTQPQYRAPSYDPYHQQQQQPTITQYRATPTRVLQTTWPPQQSNQQQPLAAAAGGYQQQQQPLQQPNQYQQQQPLQQPNQYQQQQPLQQSNQYQQPQTLYNNYQAQNQPQYQTDPNNNLYNSYSQPQQQQQQQHQPFLQSHDQLDRQQSVPPQQTSDYRGASPGIITLRSETPLTQKPAPVYTSQPAAISYQGGSNMRGDLKWPPPEYKEAADRENDERRKLALGPVCRPRRVNRDYSTFFAKNAISHHYPSYRVPPGTQHMLA